MAFRKRNIGILRTPQDPSNTTSSAPPAVPSSVPGTRPSPLDGRLTTSTGTPSLDALLAGHSGLPLGHSLLIGESGTTDYAGALAKYYAAEGVVQGHAVHVLGMPEAWGRELPGLVGSSDDTHRKSNGAGSAADNERMKIAWRYEGLGEHGRERRAPLAVDRAPQSSQTSAMPEPQAFSHTFDLTKRLVHPALTKISYIPLLPNPTASPLEPCMQHLIRALVNTPPEVVHRLLIPSLLSPALYPSHASHPSHLLAFIHRLRALTRAHPTRLVILITLPLTLYPRTTALTRWLEHLLDGVIELTPFPHTSYLHTSSSSARSSANSNSITKDEGEPQGLVKVHKLPIFHERGGGGGGGRYSLGEDMAFCVSRKRFEIRPFSLPPASGDVEAPEGGGQEGKDAAGLEF